jgi:hypothetical protein
MLRKVIIAGVHSSDVQAERGCFRYGVMVGHDLWAFGAIPR